MKPPMYVRNSILGRANSKYKGQETGMCLSREEQEGDCGKNGVSKKKSSNVREERRDPTTYSFNRT